MTLPFTNMNLKTFKFKEGTVIVEVSEWEQFDMQTKTITSTGKFTACLIGGTAPGIKPTLLRDGKKEERIFRDQADAFKAAFDLARKLGYHPVSDLKTTAKKKPGSKRRTRK